MGGGQASVSGGGAAIDISYDNTESGLSAVNVQDAVDEVAASMGDLTNLDTTDKTSIVDAINEVNAKPSGDTGVELTQTVLAGATSVTFTDAAITAGAKLLLFFTDTFIPYSAVSVGSGTVTYTIEETAANVVATLWVV